MKWLTNMAGDRARGEPDVMDLHQATSAREAKRNLRDYMRGKVIGDPKPTKSCTVKQMKRMGLVGVYAPDRHLIV